MAEFNAPQDWATLLPQLEAAVSSGSVDDFIDERLEQATVADGVPSAQPLGPSGDPTAFLLAALGVAQSESTQRDVAAALAQHGRTGDASVADALAAVYRSARSDPSRGPALLATLALRAEQDPVARSDLFGALLRLSSADSRYLLIRAAKIIGYFEGTGISTNARDKLTEWAGAEDLPVQGEARQQLALLALADALSQTDVQGVQTALHEARVAFARAEATEEMRHDARLFGALLDLLLAHLGTPGSGSEYSKNVRERAEALKSLLDDPSERPWAGYASPSERVLEYRIYRIAVGFIRVVDEVSAMEEWTNFDESLTELAATWQLMWGRVVGFEDSGQAITAPVRMVQRAEHSAVLPRVGSFLERAVGRQRICRVVERYENAFGTEGPVSEVLRAFSEAAGRAEYARERDGGTLTIDTDAFVRLAANSPDVAAQIAGLMPGAEAALRTAGLDHVVAKPARLTYPVATDNPGLYGNDPAVDETARALLQDVAARLGPGYPLPLWRRFEALTVSLVKIARDVRSDLPAFVLSAQERGGKGQQASEDDLQKYVFDALRREYGRSAHWESTGIAGGRGDAYVTFPEGAFPIEVKAEYRDITREHVREAFLAQPDRYAADRDRLAYLLILDLREGNASGELALYPLRESFWVDGLPVDPQITGAQPNGVVVGLFPGNQPKPSSTTTYSRRPRSKL